MLRARRMVLMIGLLLSGILIGSTPAAAADNPKCQLSFRVSGQAPMRANVTTGAIVPVAPGPPSATGTASPNGQASVYLQPTRDRILLLLLTPPNPSQPITLNPPGMDAANPVWSPDSTHIAFTAYQDGVYNIYLSNADGSDVHNLSNSKAQDDLAAWSPDGQWIAFRSNRTGAGSLWIIRQDGTGLQHFAAGSGPYVWSPDGHAIAAESTPNRIDVVNVAAGSVFTVGGGVVRRFGVSWSPDSRWVAYIEGGAIGGPKTDRPLGSPSGVFKMRADGSGRVRLTPLNLRVGEAAWSPDADVIAFTAGGQLYLVNGDGSNLRPVRGATQASQIQWICPVGDSF